MNKQIALLTIFGILTGVFITNAIYLIPSIEGIINLVFGIMCLIGIILTFKNHISNKRIS